MLKKFIFALILVSTCLTLVTGAKARSKSIGSGSKSVSETDLGSGR